MFLVYLLLGYFLDISDFGSYILIFVFFCGGLIFGLEDKVEVGFFK